MESTPLTRDDHLRQTTKIFGVHRPNNDLHLRVTVSNCFAATLTTFVSRAGQIGGRVGDGRVGVLERGDSIAKGGGAQRWRSNQLLGFFTLLAQERWTGGAGRARLLRLRRAGKGVGGQRFGQHLLASLDAVVTEVTTAPVTNQFVVAADEGDIFR